MCSCTVYIHVIFDTSVQSRHLLPTYKCISGQQMQPDKLGHFSKLMKLQQLHS
jgi:hypothetical protein